MNVGCWHDRASAKRAGRRARLLQKLAAVAQARGNAVDRKMDAAPDAIIRIAGAMPAQQLDLQVIERVEIGEAILDRARQ